MKVAIASLGRSINDFVCGSFRNAPYFVIIDVENGEIKSIEYILNNFIRGAMACLGIARVLKAKGVKYAVAGNFGRGCAQVLRQHGIIPLVSFDVVKDAAIKTEKGELPEFIFFRGRHGRRWM